MILKSFRKLGIAVAMSAVLTLAVPVVMPANATTMVSAATVKLSKSKITLITGKSKTLKVTGSKETVKWSSSDKSVATVNKNGKVTAKATGTATITAKVGSKKLKCVVTVKAFEGESLEFSSGVNFVVPKGWISMDGSVTGMERKLVAESEASNSYIDLRVIPTDAMTQEEFVAAIKTTVSAESQEAGLEAALGVDLTSTTFEQEASTVDDASAVCTYMEFESEGNPALQVVVYDIYDGTNMYELLSMNFYDTDVDFFDYVTYIAQNITVAE